MSEALRPGDFQFFGYTYMSGGKIGLPSEIPSIEAARPKVDELVRARLGNTGPKVAPDIYQRFAGNVPLKDPARYVKVVPWIAHDRNVLAARQYPASKLGIPQLNLIREKDFLVAAEVHRSIWQLADFAHSKLDVLERPRYDLPYAQDSRKRVKDFLANA